MSSPSNIYIRELHESQRLWPVWPPGMPVSLGTVGEFRGDMFYPTSDLASFDIAFETIQDETPIDFSFQSSDSVSVSTKLKGETSGYFAYLGEGDAGFQVTFNRTGAVLFEARECYYHRIADKLRLAQGILSLPTSVWRYPYVVVTDIIVAGVATILIAGSDVSSIVLKVNANIGNGALDIADASLGLSVANSSAIAEQFVAKHGLTPLFQALKRRRGFLRPDTAGLESLCVDDVVEVTDATMEEAAFGSVGP